MLTSYIFFIYSDILHHIRKLFYFLHLLSFYYLGFNPEKQFFHLKYLVLCMYLAVYYDSKTSLKKFRVIKEVLWSDDQIIVLYLDLLHVSSFKMILSNYDTQISMSGKKRNGKTLPQLSPVTSNKMCWYQVVLFSRTPSFPILL